MHMNARLEFAHFAEQQGHVECRVVLSPPVAAPRASLG
jgi:hypothetical protein